MALSTQERGLLVLSTAEKLDRIAQARSIAELRRMWDAWREAGILDAGRVYARYLERRVDLRQASPVAPRRDHGKGGR